MERIMKIAIIDADLIGRKKHRFPNLACEKISAYWKSKNAQVELKLDYDNFKNYDKIFISKVFTDTWVPEWIQNKINMDNGTSELPENIYVGGTGFFFDNAPNLENEIEHHMPDYNLYDDWIQSELQKYTEECKRKRVKCDQKIFLNQFKEYTDYSIGFMTRGCYRKCPFCVNQKYSHVFKHSPINEFYDPKRKKICLLDDNILGSKDWENILAELNKINRPFKFKQGMDERVLTEKKCEILFNSNYDGDFTFAFDNIDDYALVHEKLKLVRKYTDVVNVKFYVLVGFESTDVFDIENMWKRIELLMKYQCLAYIMRYQNKNDSPWKRSKYRGIYVAMARWCNQPRFYKKTSFRQYCIANQELVKTEGYICSTMRAMLDFEKEHPEIAKKYFDLRFDQLKIY